MGIFSKKDKDAKKDNAAAKAAKDDGVEKDTGTSMKDLYGDSKKDSKSEKKSINKSGNAYKILIKPLITEKAANLGTENKYVFEVAVDANKIEVAKAIQEVYGVKPINVNILNVGGKKTRHGRIIGKRRDWRKAIVTLKKGDTIKVYEGV